MTRVFYNQNIDCQQIQNLSFNYSFQQIITIFQMSNKELKSVILNELQYNPLLEEISLIKRKKINYKLFYSDLIINSEKESKNKTKYLIDSLIDESTINEVLINQINSLEINFEKRATIYYLIENLNNKGFLDVTINFIVTKLGISKDLILKSTNLLMNLDPIGMGSENIYSYFNFQLEKKKVEIYLSLF